MYYRLVFLSPKERKSELDNVVGFVCVCVCVCISLGSDGERSSYKSSFRLLCDGQG